MASKTNQKRARKAGQWHPVQPEGEGLTLLTLHLPMHNPHEGQRAGEGVEGREEQASRVAGGSRVIVLDLD